MSGLSSTRIALYSVATFLLAVVIILIFKKEEVGTVSQVNDSGVNDAQFIDLKTVRRSSMRQENSSEIPASFTEASPELQAEIQIEQVVREARERLKKFQTSHAVGELAQEERQAFIEQLQSVESPEERHQLIMVHREAALAKKEAFENQLTPEQEAERTRCQTIARLSSIQHSLPRLGWLGELRDEVESLENDLVIFAVHALDSDQTTFNQQWSAIQQKHQELSSRAMKLRQSLATQEN